jgi:hypothetical protein
MTLSKYKILIKNAVKREAGILYFIDSKGNLCSEDYRKKFTEIRRRNKKAGIKA